jgi:glutamine amidotransferase-like uncharacterized protein
MAHNIVIYQDAGVGDFSLHCLKLYFAQDPVSFCAAQDVLSGAAFKNQSIFIMPGGADIPYTQKLNGAGNANIRAFVEQGGTYLGICAGAYYGCHAIEFHKGRSDEICGPRELAFTDAIAYGSLPDIAPYYDNTLRTAAITRIQGADGTVMSTYYHGGCAFRLGEDDTSVLAEYEDIEGNPAAIITRRVGAGRVILSGVHLETIAEYLREHPEDSSYKGILFHQFSSRKDRNETYLKDILKS